MGNVIVAAPGWGLNKAMWGALRDAVVPAMQWLDACPGMTQPEELPERFIGLGHSLGALWLLREHAARMEAGIIIGGFTRFPVASRVLQRMRKRYQESPQTVLDDFHARCGTPSGIWREEARPELVRGLEWLETWEAALPPCPLLVLHGEKDEIVPVAGIWSQFPRITVCPGGGHGLPLTQPGWCAEEIRKFLGID